MEGYETKKVQSCVKLSRIALEDIELKFGQDGEDSVNELFTVCLTAKIQERTNKVQTKFADVPRQSFWDYLRGKNRTVLLSIRSYDVLAEDGKTAIPAFEVTTIKE